MTAPRRLTIVVEILASDPGARDRATDAATGVLDGVQPHQLVEAQWGDMLPEADGEQGCAHCLAEGRPCWVHAGPSRQADAISSDNPQEGTP